MIGRTNKLRATLIAGFIISFLIIGSVFFILRSQGKRFTSEGRIVSTSVIRINSIPKDVRAYIDGVEVNINDKLIQNITIGNVELILEKEGYSTWSKVVEVKSGSVADVYAQLYPEELSSTQVATQPINQIVYQDDTSHAFYSVTESQVDAELGLWKYKLAIGTLDLNRDPKPEQFSSLSKDLIASMSLGEYKMLLSPDANKLMIEIADPLQYMIIDTDNGEMTDIASLLGYTPEMVKWGNDENELLIFQDSVLTLLDTSENRKTIVSQNQDGIIGYCLAKNEYYVLNTNLNIVEKLSDSKAEPILIIPNKTITIDATARIHCSNENDVFTLKTNEGIFYVNTDKNVFSKVSNTGEVIAFSPDGFSFIYQSDGEFYSGTINPKDTDINLQIKRIDLSINGSAVSIKYSNNSEKLVVEKTDRYEIRDFDGQNPTEIFTTETFLNNSLGFSEDSKTAFIALNSAIEEDPTDIFTLYKIDLNN